MTKLEKKKFYNYLADRRDFAVRQMEKCAKKDDFECYQFFKGYAQACQSLMLRLATYC